MKIGYFGDGPWAYEALEKLFENPFLRIVFICARYDHPDLVLSKFASEKKIDFFTHPKINSDEFLEKVALYKCDLFVSMSFNQIFKHRLIEHPPKGTINCHAGKLPFYRGRNILNWVLINDENEFGITVHYMDDGIDTGDIILQETNPITDQDDYSTLLKRAYSGCANLLTRSVKQIHDGTAQRIPQKQIHALGFYCTNRKEGDEKLDWSQPSRDIFNFVRSICSPGPQARTFLGGNEILINRVEWILNAPSFKGIPGAVLAKSANCFEVKTLDSFIRVLEWSGEVTIKVGDRLK
jgi:methionyl-tRNA formyltransferase